jgi:hypothetical protein
MFQSLYDYVFCNEQSPHQFKLVSHFPRKVFELDENNDVTLSDVGLTTSATLYVHDLTEENSSEEDWVLVMAVNNGIWEVINSEPYLFQLLQEEEHWQTGLYIDRRAWYWPWTSKGVQFLIKDWSVFMAGGGGGGTEEKRVG